jgi:hypothetical protein
MGPEERFAAGAQISASRGQSRTNLLRGVPEASVGRLDLVSLEDLKKLAFGSVETDRVKRILGRMAS